MTIGYDNANRRTVADASQRCGGGIYGYDAASARHQHRRRLHQQMDAGNYDAVYGNTTSTFKAVANRETLAKFYDRIRRKMGHCDVATETSKNFQRMVPQGSFVSLGYTRQFAAGRLEEQFVWQIIDGRAVLNGFTNQPAPAH